MPEGCTLRAELLETFPRDAEIRMQIRDSEETVVADVVLSGPLDAAFLLDAAVRCSDD